MTQARGHATSMRHSMLTMAMVLFGLEGNKITSTLEEPMAAFVSSTDLQAALLAWTGTFQPWSQTTCRASSGIVHGGSAFTACMVNSGRSV